MVNIFIKKNAQLILHLLGCYICKIIIFILLSLNCLYASQIYKFRIMGNSMQNETIELPDKSIFNFFEGKGAFADSDGNIGDFSSRGVRQTNSKGILTKLTALMIFETNDGSKMWCYPTREKSELQVGAGYFDIFVASGKLKKLAEKRCQYGLTVTKNKSFVMEGFCK